MTKKYHLNCVYIETQGITASGHCILLCEGEKMVLIDTGIGLQDILNSEERIGKKLITETGYIFNENTAAIKQIEKIGLNPDWVTDCIISHLDNDHIGGVADFPNARVHVSKEEWQNFSNNNPRYLKTPLNHQPEILQYAENDTNWFGLKARKINIPRISLPILFVPLFGHTLGHCGVAFLYDNKWYFYVADAYYLREELVNDEHPVSTLAKLRADDDSLRIKSLNDIRNLFLAHPEIEIFNYHDIEEFKRLK